MTVNELIELSNKLRGLGVKIAKNPVLKKLLWEATSFLPEDVPHYT